MSTIQFNISNGGGLLNIDNARDASSMSVLSENSSYPSLLSERFDLIVNVKDFGAKGDGVTDDTQAFIDAFRYALEQSSDRYYNINPGPNSSWEIKDSLVFIPGGLYLINLTSSLLAGYIPAKELNVVGAGVSSTRIKNIGTSYLFSRSDLSSIRFTDMTIDGGPGLMRLTGTSNMVRQNFIFERVSVIRFTECGIGHTSTDAPNWKIRDCKFFPDSTEGNNAVCVALSGLTDTCDISNNEFSTYRYGLKLGYGGNNAKVYNNFFAGPSFTGGADVWISARPDKSETNSGQGLVIYSNKFGSENFSGTGKYRVLVAAEDTSSGTDFVDRQPYTTLDDAYDCVGVSFINNLISGQSGRDLGIIYSFFPLKGWRICGNVPTGSPYPYLVEYATGVSEFAGTGNKTNVMYLGNYLENEGSRSQIVNPTPNVTATNRPSQWTIIDDVGNAQGRDYIIHDQCFQGIGYIVRNNINITSSGSIYDVTKTPTTDPYNGSRASLLSYTLQTGAYITGAMTKHTKDEQSYFEIDLKKAPSNALTKLNVWMSNNSSKNHFEFCRTVDLKEEWITLRVPFKDSDEVGNRYILLQPGDYEAGVKTDVIAHNIRSYECKRPINFGNLMSMSSAWDTAHIILGAYHLWIDASGVLRIKSGAPTSDTDGTIVGTQT